MNQKLGSTARNEIRTAMTGLVGGAAKSMAISLAAAHGVSWQYIYTMTADLRKGKRKTRSDAGRRTYELIEGTDLWYAAQLVIVDKLDPDQAILTSKLRGRDKLPTLETFQKILRENGLGKSQRRNARRAHRRWEAEFPGQIFQIDVTALKSRWHDEKSRRAVTIEGIDKNHPQRDESKLRVWQIMLVDDHSRRRFLRYVTVPAITSLDMVRFECEAFEKLGIPQILYTDNGSEFKGYHIRAERILNSLLADDGGYRHDRHAPNNPQATGKVEGAHKWAEKADRFIGLAISEGQKINLEMLNNFADEMCAHYDHRVHRATGEKPINRWHGKRVVVRKVSPDVIESALMADEFEVKLDAAMTVTHKKVSYRVPSKDIDGKRTPFVDFVDRTVRVVVPKNIDIILMTLPNAADKFEPTNGGEYEIKKMVAGVDTAGEFKTVAESKAIRLTRELKDSRKQEIAAIKDQHKLTGEIAPVPHLNVPVELPQSDILNFPHREMVVSADEVNSVVPVPMPIAGNAGILPANDATRRENTAYIGKPIGYWQAVAEYQSRFASVDEAKQFLRGIFADDSVQIPVTQVEAAISGTHEQTGLRVLKTG